jgi:hypothetical protein
MEIYAVTVVLQECADTYLQLTVCKWMTLISGCGYYDVEAGY